MKTISDYIDAARRARRDHLILRLYRAGFTNSMIASYKDIKRHPKSIARIIARDRPITDEPIEQVGPKQETGK